MPLRDQSKPIQRTGHAQAIFPYRHVEIDFRGGNIFVAEKLLDRAQVRAVFQEVRREGMSQSMTRHPLLDSSRFRCPFDCGIVYRATQMVTA